MAVHAGPAPWIQCGGTGGSCTGAQCADAAWPVVTCAGDFTCQRFNSFYWQCGKSRGACNLSHPHFQRMCTLRHVCTSNTTWECFCLKQCAEPAGITHVLLCCRRPNQGDKQRLCGDRADRDIQGRRGGDRCDSRSRKFIIILARLTPMVLAMSVVRVHQLPGYGRRHGMAAYFCAQ